MGIVLIDYWAAHCKLRRNKKIIVVKVISLLKKNCLIS